MKQQLRKKVKIFAVLGVIGFFVTGALVIWAGVNAMSVAHVENLKAGVKGLKLQPLSCWGKAQSLMAVEPWLARPALDNLKNLKTACFEAAPPVCEGPECSEGKTI